MATQVTPASLEALLARPDLRAHVIGRALVVLLNRQTASERGTNSTRTTNGIGFAQMDARSGSITAKYYLKHGTLAQWQIDRWMKRSKNGTPRIVKYWRQLNDAAQQKVASPAPIAPEVATVLRNNIADIAAREAEQRIVQNLTAAIA